jgi:hypothetical protein
MCVPWPPMQARLLVEHDHPGCSVASLVSSTPPVHRRGGLREPDVVGILQVLSLRRWGYDHPMRDRRVAATCNAAAPGRAGRREEPELRDDDAHRRCAFGRLVKPAEPWGDEPSHLEEPHTLVLARREEVADAVAQTPH